MATPTDKDTIYIDIDDEITAIIDKLQASSGKVVALVLPKRAAVLQSIVNMKLLKRAADSAHKNLVLVTSEAGLLPLAGAAGVHVAKNLQSKPEIPAEPDVAPADEEVQAGEPEPSEPATDKSKSVGELATKSSAEKPKVKGEETIDVDNDSPIEEGATAAAASKAAKSKAKKDKKNKIPNFDKFRKRLLLGGAALIAILVFWFMAVFTLPKARITIKTDTNNQEVSTTFTASPSAETLNIDRGIVPARAAEAPKNDSQKGSATGKKDAGTKAAGSITVRNCDYGSGFSLPAGTQFTGDNGKAYASTAAVTVPGFSGPSSGCTLSGSSSGKATVNVQAAENGEAYNVGGQGYGFSLSSSKVDAQGGAMGGGSSKMVTVVSQQDVDAVKTKLTSSDDAAKEQLKKTLQDQGYFALVDTFTVKDETTTVTPKVGDEGSEVTVANKGTYSMLGVKEGDLKAVIDHFAKQQFDNDKQQIQEYGLGNASFKVNKTEDNGNTDLTSNTQVAVGPKIDEEQLKTEVAGKKRGDTENIIKALPGVKEAKVKYSPFWVTKTPKKASKITINFEKAN